MGATETGNRSSRRTNRVWGTVAAVLVATGLTACGSSAASTTPTTGAVAVLSRPRSSTRHRRLFPRPRRGPSSEPSR